MGQFKVTVVTSRYYTIVVDAPSMEAAVAAHAHEDVGVDLYTGGDDEGWEFVSADEYTGPNPPDVVVNQDGSPVTFRKSRAGLTGRITLVKEGE